MCERSSDFRREWQLAITLVSLLIGGVLTVIFTSTPVRAEDTWRLDPRHSVARRSLGSGSNAVGIGSARVRSRGKKVASVF